MCYPKPGPRCSGHTRTQLNDARKQHSENPNAETAEVLADAQLAYDKSPEGIAALREAGLRQDDSEAAIQLFRRADIYEEERETRLAAAALLARDGVASNFVRSAQARANVPQAYKRSSFISQEGHIGYDDDDVVGSALNSRPERSGYVADLSYELDDDLVDITANWSVSDEDGAREAMNYYELNGFDPAQRPTPEEATAISAQWNREFNENLLNVPDEASEATELGNELIDNVARNVADAYSYNFDGGEEVRGSVIHRLEQSIAVKHSVNEAQLFDANYVTSLWDDLHGDD